MKKVFLTIVLLITVSTFAQKSHRFAYIDMEYILENIPQYLDAQNTLDEKVAKWRKRLDKEARNIQVLTSDLANEKAILTKDLIEEREEEIALKQEELRRLESLYFGPNGDMFQLRKQLVKPIQDQVYNTVQRIAVRKKYDFVFDKSSDLIVLYSNKKHDISELVLKNINKARNKEKRAQNKLNKKAAREAKRKANLEKRKARLRELKQKRESRKKTSTNKEENKRKQ